jgi:hypothetical protein
MFLAAHANAATIIYEDVGFIKGTGGTTTQFRIEGSAPGYQIQLIDFAFPTEFSSIAVQIVQGDPTAPNEIGRWSVGTYDLSDLDPGVYYANVAGAMDNQLDLGLYGVQITSVPIPPGLVLFASGVVLLVLLGEHRKHVKATAMEPVTDNIYNQPASAAA